MRSQCKPATTLSPQIFLLYILRLQYIDNTMQKQSSNEPMRIILRTREQYEQQCIEIINKFFDYCGMQIGQDYFWHLVPSNNSAAVHIVLDVHSQTVPSVQLDQVAHAMYKVHKPIDLLVQKCLQEIATDKKISTFTQRTLRMDVLRHRCSELKWGH